MQLKLPKPEKNNVFVVVVVSPSILKNMCQKLDHEMKKFLILRLYYPKTSKNVKFRSSPCPQKSFVSACNICLRPETQNLKEELEELWRYGFVAGDSTRDLFGMVKWSFSRGLSDLQQGDKKVTLNHLVCVVFPHFSQLWKDGELPQISWIETTTNLHFFKHWRSMTFFFREINYNYWNHHWDVSVGKEFVGYCWESDRKHLPKNWGILQPKTVRVFIFSDFRIWILRIIAIKPLYVVLPNDIDRHPMMDISHFEGVTLKEEDSNYC